MPIARSVYIEHLVEKQIGATPPGVVPDDGIYAQRLNDHNYPLFAEDPHSIYFFYIRLNMNGALKVDHYFYFDGPPDDPAKWKKIPYGRIADKIEFLVHNARPSGAHNPAPLRQHNFEGVTFRRRSYVAFFLDEQNWSFHKRRVQNGRYAMIYNGEKAGARMEGPIASAPNYSFFDAMDLEFLMDNSDGGKSIRTGVVFINHMKKDAIGTPLGRNDKQPFAFDMYFDIRFADPSDQRLVVVFDPGGTNQGPPETP